MREFKITLSSICNANTVERTPRNANKSLFAGQILWSDAGATGAGLDGAIVCVRYDLAEASGTQQRITAVDARYLGMYNIWRLAEEGMMPHRPRNVAPWPSSLMSSTDTNE